MNSLTTTTRANPKSYTQTSSPDTGFSTAPTIKEPVRKNNADKRSKTSSRTPSAETPRESPSANAAQEISFRLDAPSAAEVLLAGDFTEWDKAPIKLTKGGGGVWHTKVALPPGRHLYRFLVDGHWQDDPNRPERTPNSFGTTNSFVDVP